MLRLDCQVSSTTIRDLSLIQLSNAKTRFCPHQFYYWNTKEGDISNVLIHLTKIKCNGSFIFMKFMFFLLLLESQTLKKKSLYCIFGILFDIFPTCSFERHHDWVWVFYIYSCHVSWAFHDLIAAHLQLYKVSLVFMATNHNGATNCGYLSSSLICCCSTRPL